MEMVMSQETPCYMFASLALSDFEKFRNEYGLPVFPTLVAAGAEVLVATDKPIVKEGQYDNT